MTFDLFEDTTSLPKTNGGDSVFGPSHARAPSVLGRLPPVAFGVALGVFIVAVGYARGRANLPWSAPLYWLGDAMVLLVPTVILVSKRNVTRIEGTGVAVIIAVATYAIKECYRPLQFTFSDEFQHLPTIQAILATHHLFHANPSLAVSPFYPGLEIVTAAVATLSHLSIYSSAAIVLGLVHLVATVALYYLALEFVPDPRFAALAVIIYATGPAYQFFLSYFAYESLALPLLIVSLLALIKMAKSSTFREVLLWGSANLMFGAATTVTHHLTSYALFGLELCVIAFEMFKPTRTRRRFALIIVAIILGAFIALWDTLVAKPTFSYLRSNISAVLHVSSVAHVSSVVLPLAGGPIWSSASASTLSPTFDRSMGYVWAVLLLTLMVFGIWRLWQKRSIATSFQIAMTLAPPLMVVAFVIAVLAPGQTRLLAFALIPGALISAITVSILVGPKGVARRYQLRTRSSKLLALASFSILASLVVGATAISWPAFYARIPGPYLLGGGDRAVDQYDLTAAEWAGGHLVHGSVVAADITNSELMDSIGHQSEPAGFLSAYLLIGSSISPAVARQIKAQNIQFVVADHRITSGIPVAGNPIFFPDPFGGHYRKPIPVASLNKFNAIAGVSRIFDDGPIVIFDLRGSTYAAPSGSP